MVTTTASVTIYTTRLCPYCVLAMRLLKRRGATFKEVDITGDPEKRAWLARTTGRRTVPQIFIGDEVVGGYVDLAALDRSGELTRRLADRAPNEADPDLASPH